MGLSPRVVFALQLLTTNTPESLTQHTCVCGASVITIT